MREYAALPIKKNNKTGEKTSVAIGVDLGRLWRACEGQPQDAPLFGRGPGSGALYKHPKVKNVVSKP